MRKLWLLTLLTGIASLTPAQNIFKSDVINAGLKGRVKSTVLNDETTKYDGAGYLISKVSNAGSTMYNYTFDANGNMIEKLVSHNYNRTPRKYRSVFQYGEVIKETVYSSDNYNHDYIWGYRLYNSDGNLVEFSDDVFVTLYKYNGKGNLIEEASYMKSDKTFHSKTTFEYALNGRLVREKYFGKDGTLHGEKFFYKDEDPQGYVRTESGKKLYVEHTYDYAGNWITVNVDFNLRNTRVIEYY